MATHPTPIDISTIPELARLVEEVATTNTPRELKRDNHTVAVLTPVTSATNTQTAYEASLAALGSWHDLDADDLIATLHRPFPMGFLPYG